MIKYLTICFVAFFGTTMHAERELGPEEFGKSTAEDAKAALARVRSHDKALAYAEAAIEARRDDLMVLCFNDPRVFHAFDEAVSKVSDARRREELMLMMLRSSSSFWVSSDFDWNRYRGKLDIDVPKIPLRRFIAHYLPEKALDQHAISSYENRLRLAAEIHKRMQGGAINGAPDASADGRPAGASTPTAQSLSSPVGGRDGQSSTSSVAINASTTDGLQKEKPGLPVASAVEPTLHSTSWPLWGGIVMGMLVLAYFLFKKREPQG